MADLRDKKIKSLRQINDNVPSWVKLAILFAFFILPLPLFLPIAIAALYYGFWVTLQHEKPKKKKLRNTTPPGEWNPIPKNLIKIKNTDSLENNVSYDKTSKRIKIKEEKAHYCPQCGNKFYFAKPQICHLSNCYYDE